MDKRVMPLALWSAVLSLIGLGINRQWPSLLWPYIGAAIILVLIVWVWLSRPTKLIATIREAYDEPLLESDSWRVIMIVRVTNGGSDPVKIADWETRLTLQERTYIGEKCKPTQSQSLDVRLPDNRVLRFAHASFIDFAPQVGGRDHVDCTVPSIFHDVPYLQFHEVMLWGRVKGVAGKWSEWHSYVPPRYTAERQKPAQWS
jgi:hypothetical protein